MDYWLGISPEGWFMFSALTLAYIFCKGMSIWDHYHPIQQTWCQGCDELQPAPSMRFTEIGLYRCSICREEPKLLDQAANTHTTNWAASLERWGTITCQCPNCKKLPEARRRMQSLQQCNECGDRSTIIEDKTPWCQTCYDEVHDSYFRPGAQF